MSKAAPSMALDGPSTPAINNRAGVPAGSGSHGPVHGSERSNQRAKQDDHEQCQKGTDDANHHHIEVTFAM